MKEVVATWGIPREKIFRVYSTLSPMDVPETKEEIRTRFGYEGFVISTAARLVPWKGVEVLINSARELRRTGIEATLEIMGDGVLQAQLVEHVQKIGAQSYVHFRGMVNKQELAERVKASDVFVLNTSYEGLSHQLLEVMDIGTPIITTPVGGNVELITEGKEGLLIPFNDTDALVHALTTLRTDAALRTSLTKNAQEKVAQFREDVIIPELVNVFA
jgi:glycosyltransferase involved in cell wall biosynthesis